MPDVSINDPMKESKLVNSFLSSKHAESLQWRRVRLGPLPSKDLARMYMTILRWVDAILVEEGIVYLIEAKLRPNPTAIGQLQLYERLFKETPEFTAYKNYPVKLMLLTTMLDVAVAELCTDKDILYEIFVPLGFNPETGEYKPLF